MILKAEYAQLCIFTQMFTSELIVYECLTNAWSIETKSTFHSKVTLMESVDAERPHVLKWNTAAAYSILTHDALS